MLLDERYVVTRYIERGVFHFTNAPLSEIFGTAAMGKMFEGEIAMTRENINERYLVILTTDELMKEKEEKGMVCENCGMCMCKTCGVITSVLFLLGSGALLAYGLTSGAGSLDTTPGDTTILVSGALFVLVDISLLVHALKMCPMCK